MVFSDALREEIGDWVQWLSNDLPPYITYRALNTTCGLAADKTPGVQLLVCREIWIRLMQACNQVQTKSSDKVSYEAQQLCTGLKCGIKGSLRAV